MRSVLYILTLAACSTDVPDVNVDVIPADPVVVTNTVVETVTVTETIEVPVESEDTGTIEEPVCGFVHSNGVYTETNLSFRLVSPIDLNTIPNRLVNYTFELTNSDCDWAEVDIVEISINDHNQAGWIEGMAASNQLATLEVPLENKSFTETPYTVEEFDIQAFYPFGNMSVWLAPGETEVFNFEFALTNVIPGDRYSMHITGIIWTDAATGTQVTTEGAELASTMSISVF